MTARGTSGVAYRPPPTGSMTGRVALVTGATGGMGRVIVGELARAGATVMAVCRSPERGEQLRRDVAHRTGADRVEVITGDLERQAEVREVAAQVLDRHDRLHVLLNNAGAHFPDQRPGPDGVERHVAVNHLAGFLLTQLLLPALQAGAPARIVNVVSDALNDTRTVKIGPRPRPATITPDQLGGIDHAKPTEVYGRSKLASLMCGYLLAERLAGTGVTVTALHPGQVDTGIIDAFSTKLTAPFLPTIRRLLLTPEQGAEPAIRLATDPALEGATGTYYRRHEQRPTTPVSYDRALQERIWAASTRLIEAKSP